MVSAGAAYRETPTELAGYGGDVELWLDGEARRLTRHAEVEGLVRGLAEEAGLSRRASWVIGARLGCVLEQLAAHTWYGGRRNVGQLFGLHHRTVTRWRRWGRLFCDARGVVDVEKVRDGIEAHDARVRAGAAGGPEIGPTLEAAVGAAAGSEDGDAERFGGLSTHEVDRVCGAMADAECSGDVGEVAPRVAQLDKTVHNSDADGWALGRTGAGRLGEQMALDGLYEAQLVFGRAAEADVGSMDDATRGRVVELAEELEALLGSPGE